MVRIYPFDCRSYYIIKLMWILEIFVIILKRLFLMVLLISTQSRGSRLCLSTTLMMILWYILSSKRSADQIMLKVVLCLTGLYRVGDLMALEWLTGMYPLIIMVLLGNMHILAFG